MSKQTPFRNSFRNAVIAGVSAPLVAQEKHPRLNNSGIVSRSERRACDHRGGDRHRLTNETAIVHHKGKSFEVELINLSAGGAMISASFKPRLWDILRLEFGASLGIECAVRWLSKDRVGLEFAHETGIDCDPETRNRLLLDVIERSFPDLRVELEAPEEFGPGVEPISRVSSETLGQRTEVRHPLVWSGQIRFVGSSTYPVRIRNISAAGALIDVSISCPLGAAVVLELGEAGHLPAKISWLAGEQAGLQFDQPFDLGCLAKLRPDLTARRWERPGFLDVVPDDCSPWRAEWSRVSLPELQEKLQGYLKH